MYLVIHPFFYISCSNYIYLLYLKFVYHFFNLIKILAWCPMFELFCGKSHL